MTTILVTGGAGYIGSHVARQLGERGEKLVTLDNLSTGFRGAVLHGEFVAGDTGDAQLVSRVLAEHRVDTVMHFAAHIQVPESVEKPLKYYRNNTANTRTLLECCIEAGVKHFVFSSTAAVYGIPESGVATEDTPTVPINPYGWSKLMSERMLQDVAAVTPLRYVALRYFNVAGADPGGRIGQSTPEATHLIKVACEHVVGRRKQISIFGTDYDTPGRHLCPRLHPRRGSRGSPSSGARPPARRRRFRDPELRLRQRLQRARSPGRSGPCVGHSAFDHGNRASRRRSAGARRGRKQDPGDAPLDAPAPGPRRDRQDRPGLGKKAPAPTDGLTVP